MEAAAPKTMVSRTKFAVGLMLLSGLLILRFGYTVCATFFPPTPVWVNPVMTGGTYILTACLIFLERNRLEEFHLDRWALGLYIVAPLLLAVFSGTIAPVAYLVWIQAACVAVLTAGLLLTRTRLPRASTTGLMGLGIGVLAGILLAGFSGTLVHLQTANMSGYSLWSELPQRLAVQLLFAASVEEPLFRGFLWGYLRQAGWKDVWVWLFQAGLFWTAHLYYVGHAWYSWWGIVPVGGLVIGWVAWRTRSIGASMLTHSLCNALGQVIGYSHW